MTFHAGQPREGVDPCIPSMPARACASCARRNDSLPADPYLRSRHVVLDASTLSWPDGNCPMRIPAPWLNPQEETDHDPVRL